MSIKGRSGCVGDVEAPLAVDGVLSPELLGKLAVELDADPQCVFDRANAETLVEVVLDALLTRLGADADYVEYWTRRDQWTVDVHRDCDEAMLTKGTMRNPTSAHILHVESAASTSPTWIWEPEAMVVVPPRTGRLVRFRGDRLHGVPHPRTAYVTPSAVADAPNEHPRRRVLLFNTWPTPPLGGVEHGEVIALDQRSGQHRIDAEERDYVRSEVAQTRWAPVEFIEEAQGGESEIVVELMGSLSRGLGLKPYLATTLNVDRSRALAAAQTEHAARVMPRGPDTPVAELPALDLDSRRSVS